MNKPPKQYYETYLADDSISDLNRMLLNEVLTLNPKSVLEYGCGTGKNLKMIQDKNPDIFVSGIDVSLLNVVHANAKNGLRHVSLGDEYDLPFVGNFDVCFTISVLDHIEDINMIVSELQRIANKAVILAECLDQEPVMYYFEHDYKSFGFEKHRWVWRSEGDGREYHLFIWTKGKKIDKGTLDDLAL